MRAQCYNPFLIEAHFSSDFGLIKLDADTGLALSAVPKRKDFNFDRRYASGRAAANWEAEAKRSAEAAYLRGEDIASVRLAPFRLAA